MSSKPRDMSTQSTLMTNPSETKDMAEELNDFWFSLPRPKQLKNKALSRVQQKKTNEYITSAFHDLVDISQKAEREDVNRRRRLESRQQQQLRTRVLDPERLAAEDFVHSRLNLPIEKYIYCIPRSWADDVAVLEADKKRKNKNKKNAYQQRNPIIKTRLSQHSKEPDAGWVGEVHLKLKEAQEVAMEQKISDARMRQLHTEMSDFDLLNRPTYYLNLDSEPKSNNRPADPLIGTPSVGDIYTKLQARISEQSLNTVLRKNEKFPYHEEFLETEEMGKNESEEMVTSVLDEDLISHDKPAEKVDFKKSKNNPTTNEPSSEAKNVDLKELDKMTESFFELSCLRDLVDITQSGDCNTPKR